MAASQAVAERDIAGRDGKQPRGGKKKNDIEHVSDPWPEWRMVIGRLALTFETKRRPRA
jgi:hypothetical protein